MTSEKSTHTHTLSHTRMQPEGTKRHINIQNYYKTIKHQFYLRDCLLLLKYMWSYFLLRISLLLYLYVTVSVELKETLPNSLPRARVKTTSVNKIRLNKNDGVLDWNKHFSLWELAQSPFFA